MRLANLVPAAVSHGIATYSEHEAYGPSCTILVVNRCKDPSLREKRILAGASMHVIPRPRMGCFQAALKKAGIEIVRPAMVA
jgi:hypothetical protein